MKKLTLALLFVMILTLSIFVLTSCGEDQDKDLAQVNVKFVVQDEVISEGVYKEGSTVDKPETTEYGAYTITHWTVNGSSKYALFPYKVGKEDLTFTAYLSHNVEVEFYAEGKKISSEVYPNNALVQAPNYPEIEGYQFKEWQLNGVGQSFPFDLTNITDDSIRFEASYEKLYKVEFMALGNVYYSKYCVYNEVLQVPTDPDINGYTFIYWVDNDNNKIVPGINVTENLSYNAIFEKNLYTVNYYLGTSTNPYKTIYTANYALDLEYTGSSVFYGWYTTRNFTTKFNFNNTLKSDVNIYGKIYYDEQAMLRTKGSTQYISIDTSSFDSLNINNVTYPTSVTLTVSGGNVIAKYSFRNTAGKMYQFTYDLLNGSMIATYGDKTAGIQIDLAPYNYTEIDYEDVDITTLYENTTLNPKLETIAKKVIETSYLYVHDLYCQLHSEVVVGGEPDPDLDYQISIVTSGNSVTIHTNEEFYSIILMDIHDNRITYVTASDTFNETNLEAGTYKVRIAFNHTESKYILRQYYNLTFTIN